MSDSQEAAPDKTPRAAGAGAAAILLVSLAALAVLLGLPYTQWFYADALRGALSIAILIVVLRVAMLDHAESLRQEPTGVAAKIGLTRKTAVEPEQDFGPEPNQRFTRGQRRRSLFMLICVIFGLAGATYNVWSFLRPDPECGGNPVRILLSGPEVQVGQIEGRRGDIDLVKGRVAALCRVEARDAALSTALGVTVSLGLVGAGLIDRRLPTPGAWPKIGWFTFLGFIGTPPARWQMNFWFILGAFVLGLLLLSIVAARTRVGDDEAKLDLPVAKLAAASAAVVLLAVITIIVVDSRAESACRVSERQSLSKRGPLLTVTRSLPAGDRRAVEQVATRYFIELVVDDPSKVDTTTAAASIEKVARLGDLGFALFTYKDNNETIRGIGAIIRRSEGWVVGDIQTSFMWDEVPKEGSNAFGFLPHGNEGVSALGGFIDPSIGTVESLGRCSAVVDRDVTTNVGAALLIVPAEGGMIRGFRAGALAGALPLSGGIAAGQTKAPDKKAGEVADRFVQGLLKNGWTGAADYVAGEAAETRVRPFARLLQGKYEKTGPARKAGRGFRFPINGKKGAAELIVELTDRTPKGWAVSSVAFLLPVTTSA